VRPLRIVRRGYQVRYEPRAIAVEVLEDQFQDILRKKSRIASQAVQALRSERDLLNPIRYGFFSVQFLTKSLLRRMLFPAYVLILTVSFMFCAVADDSIYRMILAGTGALGILGLLGKLALKDGKITQLFAGKILRASYYYWLSNYGAFKGIVLGLRGETMVQWETSKRGSL